MRKGNCKLNQKRTFPLIISFRIFIGLQEIVGVGRVSSPQCFGLLCLDGLNKFKFIIEIKRRNRYLNASLSFADSARTRGLIGFGLYSGNFSIVPFSPFKKTNGFGYKLLSSLG